MARSGLHCFVSGKVQGVSFRKSTYHKAIALGLTGSVKNLKDGRVEVFIYGEKEALNLMENWLRQGPAAARVDLMEVEPLAWRPVDNFVIL